MSESLVIFCLCAVVFFVLLLLRGWGGGGGVEQPVSKSNFFISSRVFLFLIGPRLISQHGRSSSKEGAVCLCVLSASPNRLLAALRSLYCYYKSR